MLEENKGKNKKLEYKYNIKNTLNDFIFIAVILIVSFKKDSKSFNMNVILIGLPIIFGWCMVFWLNNKELNKNKKVKNNGIKVRGTIESVYSTGSNPKRYNIIVKSYNKEYTIERIACNEAYLLVKNYLHTKKNRYLYEDPTQDMLFDIDIEIDLYIDETKVYADLDSVNIAEIEKRYNFYIKKQKEENRNYHRI